MRGIAARVVCVLTACGPSAWLSAVAAAQEATNTPAATQPGAGAFTVNQKARYTRLDEDVGALNGRGIDGADVYTLDTSITLGITGNVSLRLDVPVKFVSASGRGAASGAGPAENEDKNGLADPTFVARVRVARWDHGPIDTTRVLVFAGTQIPAGTDEVSSDSWDPVFGAALTAIRGRHGFSAGATYLLTTGGPARALEFGESSADALRLDAAHLYRLAPASWAADTSGAWYSQVELNARTETGGDAEVFLSPGLLYEGRRFAAEASVQLPVWQDVERRPETEVGVVLGVRLLF